MSFHNFIETERVYSNGLLRGCGKCYCQVAASADATAVADVVVVVVVVVIVMNI